MFDSSCREKGSNLAAYPDDYSLWMLGEWNTETGEINTEKREIANARQFIGEGKPTQKSLPLNDA